MSNYFKIANIFAHNSKVSTNDSKVDFRTFGEKFTEAKTDDFVYMNEASKCPDLQGIKSNDDALAMPAGQLFNAKGEFINGLGHAAYAAGNVFAAGGHAVTLAANLHNAFAVVTHVGSVVNEARVVLGAGVEAEKLLHKAQDAYNHLAGNPVKPHEPTKLDQAHNFVKQADDVFHENTGYLTMGLNAVKTYFYPENLVGFFSRSSKAITNAYQAVKCEVNAATALVKAGYYKATEVINAFDDSSEAKQAQSFGQKYKEWLDLKGSFSPQESLLIKTSPLLEGMLDATNYGLDKIDLGGDIVTEVSIAS